MTRSTSLDQAKTHLSQLIRAAEQGEVQLITRHGRPAAYLLSPADYARLTGSTGTLADLFQNAPKGEELDLERMPGAPRDIEF